MGPHDTRQAVRLATLRHLGLWLLALFVVAQTVGLLPSIVTHTHEVALQLSTGDGTDTPQQSDADRDGHCCTVHHHLLAVAPDLTSHVSLPVAAATTVAAFTSPLVAPDLTRLDRPPKHMLLI